MKVEVHVMFRSPNDDDRANMESLARSVTNDAQSVRMFSVKGRPSWLAAEFTMPTEAQYKAIEKIEPALRLYAGNRLDSAIDFPKSAAERAAADRKAERHTARRCATREGESARGTMP